MIRALYTAASGMNAQQLNMDNVANNLANVNTAGFKKSRVEFQDLVYQEMRAAGTQASSSTEAPTGLEVGLGTKPVATARDFSAGNLRSTAAPLDLAINGAGFFQVSMPDGTTAYTRAGSFHLNAQGVVVTSDGYPLEPAITIPATATSVTISNDGVVSATIAGQTAAQQLGTIYARQLHQPGRVDAARRDALLADERHGRPADGPSGDRGAGQPHAGVPRGFERERGRGDGQHDHRPARL